MKAVIHVNQHNIRHNTKAPEDLKPVITVKTYKSNTYCNEVKIDGPSTVIYRPNSPLSCGAKVWIEANYGDVEVIS